MGKKKMASLRAAHGRPEALHVRYWEIGDEIWGDWLRGHSDAQTYSKNLNRHERGGDVIQMSAVWIMPSVHPFTMSDGQNTSVTKT
jgi:alpha-L-arabinofuranosidase